MFNELYKIFDITFSSITEMAFDRETVRRDLQSHSVSVFQHIVKLQLFEFDSDILKTIYDIYEYIDDKFNSDKKSQKHMTSNNINLWLFSCVENENEYKERTEKLFKKLKNNYICLCCLVANYINISLQNFKINFFKRKD